MCVYLGTRGYRAMGAEQDWKKLQLQVIINNLEISNLQEDVHGSYVSPTLLNARDLSSHGLC